MRIFIAINFSESVKDSIQALSDGIHAGSLRGDFAVRDNLHLTLAFIGETVRIETLKHLLDDLPREGFQLVVEKHGHFARPEGDILYLGIRRSAPLMELAATLRTRLSEAGFPTEERPFKPHITLARRQKCRKGFDPEKLLAQMPPLTMQVGRVSLMKSENIRGKIVYSEIYGVDLQ